jgi:hypothetical protein
MKDSIVRIAVTLLDVGPAAVRSMANAHQEDENLMTASPVD